MMSTVHKLALLVLGGMAVFMALFNRRRPHYPTAVLRPYEWHRCGVCPTMIRPREILCTEHIVLVPVPTRIALTKLMRSGPEQSKAWASCACNAIGFVWTLLQERDE